MKKDKKKSKKKKKKKKKKEEEEEDDSDVSYNDKENTKNNKDDEIVYTAEYGEEGELLGCSVTTNRPATTTSALSGHSAKTTESHSTTGSWLKSVWNKTGSKQKKKSAKRPTTSTSNESPSTGHQAKKPSMLSKLGSGCKYIMLLQMILLSF